MHKNSLIYIIEDDPDFGKLLYVRLRREKFNNVVLYFDENECLKDIKNHPKILIVDYHLNHMTGLQLIQKAKAIYPNFFSVLISGEFQDNIYKINDERFIRYVDKLIIKGMDEINELVDTLTHMQPVA